MKNLIDGFVSISTKRKVFAVIALAVLATFLWFLANPPLQYAVDQLLFSVGFFTQAEELIADGKSNGDAAALALSKATRDFEKDHGPNIVQSWAPVVRIENLSRGQKLISIEFKHPNVTCKTHVYVPLSTRILENP